MLKGIQEKQREARSLTKKLDRSMAIEWLWPEVFDKGRPRSYWFGKANHGNVMLRDATHQHHEFVITNGAGEQRFFNWGDVPDVLGGGYTGRISIKK